jgi:putative inorganic carbon (hco3(-)) transporter
MAMFVPCLSNFSINYQLPITNSGMPQINSQQLGWLELTVALLAALLWYSFPQIGWWPVLIMGLPVGARLWARQNLLVRTPLDIFLLLFLVTAVIGLWAAYDRPAAAGKFWVLTGAVFLYYALAGQPRANIWAAAAVMILLGAGVATFFLLTHDWRDLPADLAILNQIGLRLMRLQPELLRGNIVDNIAGGILAGLVPLAISWGLYSWQRRQRLALLLVSLAGGLMLFGLLMTSSRAAWLALAAAAGVWLLWRVSGRLLPHDGYGRLLVVGGILLVGATAVLAVAYGYFGGLVGLANALPGAPSGTTRYELWQSSLYLADDFLWTGGGLTAFAGLYSQYIQVIPFFLYSYSHNFYLDLLLEQGLLGLLACLSVMAGAIWLLWRPSGKGPAEEKETAYLRWGLFTGLLAVGLHSFTDSALYAGQGTPFLFIWAGLAVALQRPVVVRPAPVENGDKQMTWLVTAAVIVFLLVAGYLFRHALAASWQANLGAVAMAQVELADYPANQWVGDRHVAALQPAVARFERALAANPANGVAHHRLGLMALAAAEFETAAVHLEAARAAQPGHRGIVKTLGYGYLWSGQLDKAMPLLSGLPEIPGELDAYTWWWTEQGQPGLARYAHQLRSNLE